MEGLLVFILIAVPLIALAAGYLLLTHRTKARPHSAEYEESVEHLERLKSGRLWGDLSAPDPRE